MCSESVVCIHFSFDNWQPDPMVWDSVDALWTLYRVCPPGRHQYYFSFAEDRPFLSSDVEFHGTCPLKAVHYSISKPPETLSYLHFRVVERREGRSYPDLFVHVVCDLRCICGIFLGRFFHYHDYSVVVRRSSGFTA